jgi:hypothetical protein
MLRPGFVLCLILLSAVTVLRVAGAAPALALRVPQQEVGKYARIEMLIETDRPYDNPFDPCEVELNVLIATPGGQTLTLPAFFGQEYERRDLQRNGKTVAWCCPHGTGVWKARFAPMEVGPHTARAVLKDGQGETTSAPVAFACVASASKGFLQAGREDPRFLQFTEGQPFFAIGQNLAFIGEGQYVTIPKAEEIFGKLAANGANFLRIWTCCQDWALAIEARKSAWGRSWSHESSVVPLPGHEAETTAPKCVKIEGPNGASLAADPSHPVALRPATTYVLSGKLQMDGPQAVRVQAAGRQWEIPAGAEWQSFAKEFTTGANEYWLGRVTFSLVGAGTAWLDGLSLKEAAGSTELLWEADVNRPVRGYYNPLDCFMLDQLMEAAEQNGLYLMLCAITRDLYMDSLSKVDSAEYRQATADARKFMRYAVARWGYSASVAAWEYFNEMDPGKPTDRFYAEVGDYLAQVDLYHHLRTTSTWASSARDCRHAQLDIAQEHHYMRPADEDFKDEVESVIRQSRWLREQAPNKPALIGEFGLATPQWGLSDYMKQDRAGVHFHNCLWASAFTGTSGTTLFWWWDLLDPQNAYGHYQPLAAFFADISPAGLQLTTAAATEPRLRILGYQGDDRAYLWLVNRQATWWNLVVDKRQPEEIEAATITLEGLRPGNYAVMWWDTHKGEAVSRQTATASQGHLPVTVPAFAWDLACKIVPVAE